jgi:hypothetical protein
LGIFALILVVLESINIQYHPSRNEGGGRKMEMKPTLKRKSKCCGEPLRKVKCVDGIEKYCSNCNF